MKTHLLVLALSVLLTSSLLAVDPPQNPFESYLNKIEKLEAKLEKAGERKKTLYEKDLDKLNKQLNAAVEKRKKPLLDAIEKCEKAIESSKSKHAIEKNEKKIAELKKKIAQIDAWASGDDEEDDNEETVKPSKPLKTN